ncbi:hypothetical protein [Bacillus amyloliquefaciens]|uniref:hypothetical protein n=1 Tax=Bacillus amyloliquefaciens TaxID=1390 RepID=UPI003A896074
MIKLIKNGNYCIFKGEEYEMSEDMDGNLLILTDNPLSIKEGFIDRFNSKVFSKIVTPHEITNCYSIKTKGKLDGKVVNISKETTDQYYVGTSDSLIAQELGLEQTDKYYYDKWISKDRVEVFEEKIDIKF